MVALVILAIPVVALALMVALVGLRMREASASVRRFCSDHPVGRVVDVAASRRRGVDAGLRVDVRAAEGGPSHLEARGGALTTVYLCDVELQGSTVTSSHFVRED